MWPAKSSASFWRCSLFLAFLAVPLTAQTRTILAIGAHAGDMELTAGALLARQKALGDRTVLLHLTLGEGGNPKLAPKLYGEQKRREAEAAAKSLGAEVLFGPYKDGLLPDDESTRRWVADVIRQVKPTYIVTHWKNSIHKDHATTHRIVEDAVLLAALEDVVTGHPPYRGIQSVLYAENWEDSEDFRPYVYVDVSKVFEKWREAVRQYEFVRGGIAAFHYLDYYEGLARVRGAESSKRLAEAFDVPALAKKRVLDSLP